MDLEYDELTCQLQMNAAPQPDVLRVATRRIYDLCSDRPVAKGRLPPMATFDVFAFDVARHHPDALADGCRLGAYPGQRY